MKCFRTAGLSSTHNGIWCTRDVCVGVCVCEREYIRVCEVRNDVRVWVCVSVVCVDVSVQVCVCRCMCVGVCGCVGACVWL